MKLLEELDMIGALFSHLPALRFIAPEMSGYKPFLETHQELWAFVKVSGDIVLINVNGIGPSLIKSIKQRSILIVERIVE